MQLLSTALFVLLALVAIRGWRRRRTPESAWVAAAFATMATVMVLRLLLPGSSEGVAAIGLRKLLLSLLTLVPYFLYRFARTLRFGTGKFNSWDTWLTGFPVLALVAAPGFPSPDESWPLWFGGLAVVLLGQWVTLSAAAALLLFKGSAGKPTVARRRMRTLSLASALLSVVLVAFVVLNAAGRPSMALIPALSMGSGALFFLGFAPPAWLRKIWRRREEELLQKAQLGLMSANTPQEVGARILPYVAGTLGGWGAALVDHSHGLLGAYAVDPETVNDALAGSPDQETVQVPLHSGSLIIWTSSYAPFFGQEELAMLETFGVMIDLALDRCELMEAQRIAVESLAHTNEQLAEARDAAMESSRLKSEFLATMSHEIRTPMNGVTGLTGLLLNTELDERQRSFAEGVRSASEALLAIINDILDFSKIEANRLTPEVMPFALPDVVHEVVRLLAEAVRTKGLELEVDVAGDIPRALLGDPARLRQILLNLVSNAVKFTETGRVQVRARMVSETDTAVQVKIEVEDTGIGVAGEDMKKLFEPFSQVDSSTTRQFGGSGLGLAISRRLVEMLGGEMGVDTEPGRGSTFWFVLPLTKAAETVPEPGSDKSSSEPAAAAGPGTEGRVLIVEDNSINQMVAIAIVEGFGYSVDVASNGFEALERVKQSSYSAVLMDCQMPQMDGYSATREIRRLEGPAARVPVVAMTAAAMEGDREKCLEAGMDDYISKPIRPETVKAALERWVSKQVA